MILSDYNIIYHEKILKIIVSKYQLTEFAKFEVSNEQR